MLEFDYRAFNTEGQATSGRIAAESAAAATAALAGQGLAVQSLRQVVVIESAGNAVVTPVPQDECERVLQERVSQLLEQREVLAPALKAFAAEMPTGRPRRELRKLAVQFSDGASAEQIVSDTNLSVLLPLLGNDAMRGSHRSLENLLAESAQRNRTRTERVRILTYPLFVVLLASAVLIFLGLIVVPTFTDIFNDFDLELPRVTMVVVDFSNQLLFHPVRLLISVAGVIVIISLAFYLLKHWGFTGRWLGDFTSGSSNQVAALAVFARTLAEALGAGFSLSCALRMAGKSSNLRWLRREAETLAATAENEWCLPETTTQEARLPATVSYALRAGPSGAPSLPLLRELAELYAERVRDRLDWSTGFMSQLMILLIGIVVGIVVLALYLPLVTLINGLTG